MLLLFLQGLILQAWVAGASSLQINAGQTRASQAEASTLAVSAASPAQLEATTTHGTAAAMMC
jgi:hypothetical protein